MSSHPLIYEAADVAALLGVTLSTLPRKWRRLHEEHGFPRPLAGRPDAWSRALVDAWVNGEHATPAPPQRRQATIQRQRQALEARYVGGMNG